MALLTCLCIITVQSLGSVWSIHGPASYWSPLIVYSAEAVGMWVFIFPYTKKILPSPLVYQLIETMHDNVSIIYLPTW